MTTVAASVAVLRWAAQRARLRRKVRQRPESQSEFNTNFSPGQANTARAYRGNPTELA